MLINRDPFAREEMHRDIETIHNYTCDFCGTWRTTKRGTRYLYRYSTQTDGGRHFDHKGLFCCKSCHDAYHS